MKIYTKGGDGGETGLLGGLRVPKDDYRVRVCGSLDELNAALGLALSMGAQTELREVQSELFHLGAEIATPRGVASHLKRPISEKETIRIESAIDEKEAGLKPLEHFILPGGDSSASVLHLARAICRRVEREIVTLHRQEPIRGEVLRYLNRLSDYLFVLARERNAQTQTPEELW